MDTTKLEYEFFKLVERVNLLESQHEYDKKNLDMVIRKTAGAVDPMPAPPPAPKFWVRWKADGCDFLYSYELNETKTVPVYCFTREMLIAAYTEIRRLEFTEGTISQAVDSYLKSNGGV